MEDLDGPWSERGSPPQAAAGTNTSWTEGAKLGVSRRTQVVLEIIMVLMCVGAVAGNILVMVIVAATKSFHSVTSVLIMNLAVSDLLVGIGAMPFVVVSILNHRWVDWTGLCLYVGYTSSVYCTASVLTLAAIAFDRYYSIMDCLRYSSRCTLWRTCAVVLWIWLQALATSCPPLLGWSSISYVPPMYSCAVDWAGSPGYTVFVALPSYLLPAVVILFSYVNIVKVAHSHARRIHTLEDSVQRCRSPGSVPTAGASPHQHSPSRLIYHVSGQFVSQLRAEGGDFTTDAPADSAMEESNTSSRRFFSFLAQSVSQGSLQNSQQHHGVIRLFMVISAFFFCWTPYVTVTLLQATETAISGQSSLVPSSAVTVSYWLMLLNSDINPLLYALLSKRFQNALQGLGQKLRARVGSVVVGRGGGGGGRVRNRGHDGQHTDPPPLSTTRLSAPSSSDSSSSDSSKSSSSILSITDLKHTSEELLYRPENISSTCLSRDTAGGRKMDSLQVPSRPQEGNRLPFSALTEERPATFFYGQITVRVEHDV